MMQVHLQSWTQWILTCEDIKPEKQPTNMFPNKTEDRNRESLDRTQSEWSKPTAAGPGSFNEFDLISKNLSSLILVGATSSVKNWAVRKSADNDDDVWDISDYLRELN